ncbi:tryptophan halogenase family protein [Hirschia baltica]|uniref:Tryptophan halogenase n=1 Tax=Hirschia baltica (strain ATCC 49814 / DSM 5838 / IFAM 1418) TaxID=582402 RepID=C6XNJ5_HIRBI|nr:tryptophan halogenase family protein [Hirschia baltica]ACT60139.1 tryptophan halogenase [Hirschia baltica ATCC 49814]
MSNTQIQKIVIVGGGTAGWISAAALAKLLPPSISVTLIESDSIATVGVGEATIPQIRRLNGMLGLNENTFLKATKGTIKLGIEFSNWGKIGESYLHTFGDVGLNLSNLQFHHYWKRAQEEGKQSSLWDYSLHHKVAYSNKFDRLERIGKTGMTGLSYAFHFDAGLYARFLRNFAETSGVTRIEGFVKQTVLNPHTGFIDHVKLENGTQIEGDLFIDCSGFRGLLIDKALGVSYQDWTHWLPCNRAIAVPSQSTRPLVPYTKSIAHTAGWQWCIPLQHRTGNGHVYSDQFMQDETALEVLLSNLDSTPIAEPNHIRFTTGRREKFWHKNCISIGLSSGFLEPLESTSIHLIQSNISRLIELLPTKKMEPANSNEYNRQVSKEYELIRDFIILHYHCTQREDSDFWRYCKNMDIPDSLKQKLELFSATGRIHKEPEDLFREASWVQVMIGQGLIPQSYHAMADRLSTDQLEKFLADIDAIIAQAEAQLPSHEDFLTRNCQLDLQ